MKLCTECYYVGKEKSKHGGSFISELMLWGSVVLFGFGGFIFPVLWIFAFILFIVGIIYSLGRLKTTKICPKCEKPSMIPAASQRGEQIIKDNSIPMPEWWYKRNRREHEGSASVVIKVVLIMAIIITIAYYIIGNYFV